jgi:hypothetical protein
VEVDPLSEDIWTQVAQSLSSKAVESVVGKLGKALSRGISIKLPTWVAGSPHCITFAFFFLTLEKYFVVGKILAASFS